MGKLRGIARDPGGRRERSGLPFGHSPPSPGPHQTQALDVLSSLTGISISSFGVRVYGWNTSLRTFATLVTANHNGISRNTGDNRLSPSNTTINAEIQCERQNGQSTAAPQDSSPRSSLFLLAASRRQRKMTPWWIVSTDCQTAKPPIRARAIQCIRCWYGFYAYFDLSTRFFIGSTLVLRQCQLRNPILPCM